MKADAGEYHARNFTQLASSYQQIIEDQTPLKNKDKYDNGGYDAFLSPLGIKLHQPQTQRDSNENE